MKLAIVVIFTLSNCFLYYNARFVRRWTQVNTCSWFGCHNLQTMYLSAKSNEIVFNLKLLFRLCRGHRYAMLKVPLTDPRVQPQRHRSLIFRVRSPSQSQDISDVQNRDILVDASLSRAQTVGCDHELLPSAGVCTSEVQPAVARMPCISELHPTIEGDQDGETCFGTCLPIAVD